MDNQADVIIVGAGLAGLVAAAELADAGKYVIIVDQEPEQNLGGQAFWSFGGLFLVDSPEQRRLGVRDSYELALQDWLGTAGFDRPEDEWPRRWAESYVGFAAGEKRAWLHAQGMRWFPVVGWAERGGYGAIGHGNSVPRFHVTWGTGPAVLEPFVRRVRAAVARGLITLCFRHRVGVLTVEGGAVTGVSGDILAPSSAPRGRPSGREVIGAFALTAQAVIVTAGGIGGNHDLVRANWPARLGAAPRHMIAGVPDYVDGRMLAVTAAAGGRLINSDRMWHYTEGLHNWNPLWTAHGIRILPGPSSLWLDARGGRLPTPLFPGFDTLGTLQHLMATGHDYSWFVLTQRIIEKEFALSGSEQNPDLTGKSWRRVLARLLPGAPGPVEAFKRHGADFVVRGTVAELAAGMNALTGDDLIDAGALEREIVARDRQLDNPFSKDSADHGAAGRAAVRGRQADPRRQAAPPAGPCGRPADRGAAKHPNPQNPRWPPDRPGRPGARRRRRAGGRAVCGGRGRRIWWRRHARLPCAGGHLSRRLHILGPQRGPGRRGRGDLARHPHALAVQNADDLAGKLAWADWLAKKAIEAGDLDLVHLFLTGKARHDDNGGVAQLRMVAQLWQQTIGGLIAEINIEQDEIDLTVGLGGERHKQCLARLIAPAVGDAGGDAQQFQHHKPAIGVVLDDHHVRIFDRHTQPHVIARWRGGWGAPPEL